MPMYKIRESATGKVDDRWGIVVGVSILGPADSDPVRVQIQDTGVQVRIGETYEVPRSALKLSDDYSD